MKKIFLTGLLFVLYARAYCWGFYVHQLINHYAVFLLPPSMISFYKPNIQFISDHAVDPDKRRYAVAAEAPRHFIDMDRYGPPPYLRLKRKWKDAIQSLPEDSLRAHGIVPWWIEIMMNRLTAAFREKNAIKILKLSADIGHYIGDAHVPLHTSSNHNGQLTNQRGIHGFWESRVPELLAEKNWDFLIGRAIYIKRPLDFIWDRILESAAESDSVLRIERELNASFPADQKYGFEDRKGVTVKQYAAAYCKRYDELLGHMAERRFRQAVLCVASFWYTAWVNAGQPDLNKLTGKELTAKDQQEFDTLNSDWKKGLLKGRDCD